MRWCRFGVSLSIVFVCGSILGCADPALEKAKADKSKKRDLEPGKVDPDAPKEFTTLNSGVKYRILRKSDGKKIAEHGSNLSVLYRGSYNGTIFVSCYGKSGAVRTIDSRQMYPCWKETLPLIGEGGMIEVESPAKLTSSDLDRPSNVPVEATVHYLVELIKVNDFPPPPSETPKVPPVSMGQADPNAPEEFTTTASGLKYRIRRKSKGLITGKTNPNILVHYRGSLDDGTVFDDSYDRGLPAQIDLTRVIDGWKEGIQFTGEGGMIELEIPPEIGYGPKGMPPAIPPNATLHFVLEVIKAN